MNEKKYLSPSMVVYFLDNQDVITTSGDNDTPWDEYWTNIY